jgi:hypothetical protein
MEPRGDITHAIKNHLSGCSLLTRFVVLLTFLPLIWAIPDLRAMVLQDASVRWGEPRAAVEDRLEAAVDAEDGPTLTAERVRGLWPPNPSEEIKSLFPKDPPLANNIYQIIARAKLQETLAKGGLRPATRTN